jgi:hypothetical protein
MILTNGLAQGLIFFAGFCVVVLLYERLRIAFRKSAPKITLDPAEVSKLRARIARMARPALSLGPAPSPAFSKIGGRPELASDVSWPVGEEGPLAFVAQIDLEAVKSEIGFDWLPEEGRIYLFFDDERNGLADCGKIIFTRAAPGPEANPPQPLPKHRRFDERRVNFRRFTSLPSEDWLGEEWPSGLSLGEGATLEEATFGDDPDHRVGGYPSEIQASQMFLECEYLHRGLTLDYRAPVPDDLLQASRQWRLLLQIDSDPALKMNWWDGGRLYVFARTRDVKRGDFSKTVTITQTH